MVDDELTAAINRRRLLVAYAVSELDSIVQALWVLSDQGSDEARHQAIVLQRTLDQTTITWAAERGIYIANKDSLVEVVNDARNYVAQRIEALESILDQGGGKD